MCILNKTFICFFIAFFGIIFFNYQGFGCDPAEVMGYMGTFYKGQLVRGAREQRVQDAICEAMQDIENCSFLNEFQKNKIRTNRNMKKKFTINFDSFGDCGQGRANIGITDIFISESLMNDDSNSLCCSLKATIGHELLHLWYPLGGDQTSECKAYRIEKECLCSKTQTPTYR